MNLNIAAELSSTISAKSEIVIDYLLSISQLQNIADK